MATEAIKKGRVSVNGQTAKPSLDVFPMDKIVLRKDQINYQIKVLDIPLNRLGAKYYTFYN